MKARILFCTLNVFLVVIMAAGAGRTASAGTGEVNSRIRSVENGLRMQFEVEGYDEFQGAHNIYDRMKHYNVPGVSVAVINEGRIEWAKGYGELETGTGRMVDTETLFQVASIGKPIMAAGALRLVEEGMLALDRDVNDYLSSWRLPDNEFTADVDVTLEMLLSHTGGTTVHGFPGYAEGSDLPTLFDILEGEPPCNTPAVRVEIVPGTQWRYSGGGFMIVQQMFEDVLGRPFPESMRELVFEPAGMERTFYHERLPAHLEKNTAFAYLVDGSAVEGGYHLYPEFGAGAGLWSTPSDLARFAIAIQRSYAGRPGGLLEKKTARDMLAPRMGSYGLGFAVTGESGEVSFSHSGGNRGYRNFLVAYAGTGRGAAIMTSSDAGNDLCSEIVRAIAVAYDWPDYRPETVTPAVLTREQLETLAGSYELPGIGTVPLWVEDGHLFAPDPQLEGASVLLIPRSPTSFLSPSDGWIIDFLVDESGEVTGLNVSGEGIMLNGTRVR